MTLLSLDIFIFFLGRIEKAQREKKEEKEKL